MLAIIARHDNHMREISDGLIIVTSQHHHLIMILINRVTLVLHSSLISNIFKGKATNHIQTLMTRSISTMSSITVLQRLVLKEHVFNAGFWLSVVLYGVCVCVHVCVCILTDKQDEVEFPHCC